MKNQPLQILYEDDHILVCVKPHGVATQTRSSFAQDMVSLLKNHLHQENPSGGEPYLAVIHRLDQPVSGILVFGKTSFAASELSRQLQGHTIGKYYRAFVEKRPLREEALVEDYLVKDSRGNTSAICSPDTPGAKLARLHYSIVADDTVLFKEDLLPPQTPNDACELDIQLETGRHHQIRVQLAHLGCPIIGDTKYNTKEGATGWNQICLCAYKITFRHPKTKREMTFSLLT